MNTKPDGQGPQHCQVRPAAYRVKLARPESGMVHIYAEDARQLAYMPAPVEPVFVQADIDAAVSAERGRIAVELTKRAEALNTTGARCAPHIQMQYEAMAGELIDWACVLGPNAKLTGSDDDQ